VWFNPALVPGDLVDDLHQTLQRVRSSLDVELMAHAREVVLRACRLVESVPDGAHQEILDASGAMKLERLLRAASSLCDPYSDVPIDDAREALELELNGCSASDDH
jgi:hypothetical protein